MKPIHKHDCQRCKFLGTTHVMNATRGDQQVFDLYVCLKYDDDPVKRSLNDVLARYTSDGPDYVSAPLWSALSCGSHDAVLRMAAEHYLHSLNYHMWGIQENGLWIYTDTSDISILEFMPHNKRD